MGSDAEVEQSSSLGGGKVWERLVDVESVHGPRQAGETVFREASRLRLEPQQRKKMPRQESRERSLGRVGRRGSRHGRGWVVRSIPLSAPCPGAAEKWKKMTEAQLTDLESEVTRDVGGSW